MIWLLIPALISGLAIFLGSNWGLGIIPDSITYFDAARHVAAGHGVCVTNIDNFVPLTHFPPLLPVLLGILSKYGIEVQEVFRLMNILLAVLNTFIYSALFLTLSRNIWASSIFALMLGLAPASIEIYAGALSEPLYMFFQGATLVALYSHFRWKSTVMFPIAIVSLALALLTRYAAGGLLGFTVLAIALNGDVKKKERILKCALAFLSIVPLLLWLIASSSSAAAIADRTFSIHLPSSSQLLAGLRTIGDWFIPIQYTSLSSAIIFGVFFIVLFIFASRAARSFLTLFAFCYLSFILFSISTFDAETPLNSRILYPIFPVVLSALLLLIFQITGSNARTLALYSAPIFFLLAMRTFDLILERRLNGYGFNSRAWVESPIIDQVRHLPAMSDIYSNGTDVILLQTGRTARGLPSQIEADTRIERSSFQHDMKQLRQKLHEGNGGYVILLRNITWRWYLPKEEIIKELLSLETLIEVSDGVILTPSTGRDTVIVP